MSTKSKTKKKNKFMRFITAPLRVLYKARDCYVGNMNNFADTGRYGNMGGPAGVPRSFSVSSTIRSDESEDERHVRELLRVLSAKSAPNSTMGSPSPDDNKNLDLYVKQMRNSAAMGSTKVPRSVSVGMGKIEEEPGDEFGEENSYNGKVKQEGVYPRSRSYAVPQRKGGF